MSQAIAYFFWGIPLVDENFKRSNAVEQLIEDKPDGVHTYYSGNGTYKRAAAFGIELDQLSEGDHHDEMSGLVTQPEPHHILEYDELFEALTDEQKAAVRECGDSPRVLVMWGSS
jgi:pyruvate/2-oxoacid:ferredoxin oxidoreductase alpha subunit